ncbi:MAG: hypothetical protein LBC78_05250 [Oscillospiraceae bacterium]|nr:hypothetical protein [Oscillospiraceae bacterium]
MDSNRLVYGIVAGEEGVLNIERLLNRESLVMNGIDHHVLLAVSYSMRGDLFSLMAGGEQIIQRDDCHILAGVF